jgi:hypothetical protein
MPDVCTRRPPIARTCAANPTDAENAASWICTGQQLGDTCSATCDVVSSGDVILTCTIDGWEQSSDCKQGTLKDLARAPAV